MGAVETKFSGSIERCFYYNHLFPNSFSTFFYYFLDAKKPYQNYESRSSDLENYKMAYEDIEKYGMPLRQAAEKYIYTVRS